MQESRHAQDEEKEDQTRHEDPLAAHHNHLRDGRHASCPSEGDGGKRVREIVLRRDRTPTIWKEGLHSSSEHQVPQIT